MWKEIMETDSGKEFGEWLYKEYDYIPSVADGSYYEENCDCSEKWIPNNIINNLAIEWLDDKCYKLYMWEGHSKKLGKIWMIDINVSVKKDLYRIEHKGKRSEAIAEGVKKAFSLIEGGE